MPQLECDRFWYPSGTVPNLSDEGFLTNPAGEYGRFLNPNLWSLDHFDSEPILLLLGEPGAGKSTDLKRAYSRVATDAELGLSHWVNLGTIGSDSGLRQIFQSPIIKSWLCGSQHLTLFLDSLDESLVNTRLAVSVLLEEIEKLPVDRLKLRVTCRSAELPSGVAESLKNICNSEPKLLFLAPLRRDDVAFAAAHFNIRNTEAFVSEIVSRDVVSLALNPITLRFLIEKYLEGRSLSNRRQELFTSGLRRLCSDPNNTMRSSPSDANAEAEERFAIAARIAAVSVFSNRVRISDEDDPAAVSVACLSGGTERIGNYEVTVSPQAISATLKTALFTSSGYWSHRTYCEFLAASYITAHRLPPTAVLTLLKHQSDPEGHIAPQLHETAAWVASPSQPVFDHIVDTEPEILLDSDTGALDDKQKARLVEAILRNADNFRLSIGLHKYWFCARI